MQDRYLCHIDELPELGCREFERSGEKLFVVKQGEQLFVYLNQCPHIGTPLNWKPDQFLSHQQDYIQCSSHGALFEIASGLCVAGPCSGQSLQALDYRIEEGEVFLDVRR